MNNPCYENKALNVNTPLDVFIVYTRDIFLMQGRTLVFLNIKEQYNNNIQHSVRPGRHVIVIN